MKELEQYRKESKIDTLTLTELINSHRREREVMQDYGKNIAEAYRRGFDYGLKSAIVGHKSPEELSKMTVAELAKYINE